MNNDKTFSTVPLDCLIMETRWYVGARSCIRRCDHALTIDNRSEALRPMVNILANDREITRWCRPTGLT